MPTLRVSADAETLARDTASWLTDLAVAKQGWFVLALSGGSTPKRLYELLAAEPFRDRFPWTRTVFVFGDERFVPPDHKDSNYRMAREAMLDHVPVPAANVLPVPTVGVTPEEAADRYDQAMRELAEQHSPALFDVTLLGLGEDGHTASLIPGQPVLDERTRWVSLVPKGRDEQRITLTYPAIARSRVAAFLIAGAGKTAMLDRLMSGATDIPAGRITAEEEVLVLADRAAAGRLA